MFKKIKFTGPMLRKIQMELEEGRSYNYLIVKYGIHPSMLDKLRSKSMDRQRYTWMTNTGGVPDEIWA